MLSLAEVRRAREVLAPHVFRTPLRPSYALRPKRAYLKLECWQPTGSFKVRGATNLLASLSPEERGRGVVTASAGNHALGVAFAARSLGGRVEATVFVPRTAPRSKLEKLRTFPVRVEEAGATYDDAHAEALAHARRSGATYVHAFDDPRTAAGQGTIGLEILEDLPRLGAIVVPVGGGGLLAGIASAVKPLAPSVRIIAVQPEASPALRESLKRGEALKSYAAGPTLADGLAGGIGDIVFAHRHLVDEVITVSEEEIAEAIVALVAADQVVAEAAGAVGVAAVRSGKVPLADTQDVAVVVTGGNIDPEILARLLCSRF